ncbi:hypothetical protein BDQ12DRAFT_691974 [Crucibulum laeve]|uniref:Uncharacterized protein n=1 Tax=Crucibulum laeve TaxID=68775 RepID=A0A5C3LVL5_9AGAR|nr:hypothetical protein BDQ12DRAFT_691974 [Crucibulum laeve]
MHPYHYRPMGLWCRGPSRILWFAVGAGTAAWWIKHKDTERRPFGHCVRPLLQAPPPPSPPTPPSEDWTPREISKAINNLGGKVEWGRGEQQTSHTWEDEQVAAFTRQAADTMTELTESTLDSVLSTAQALKAKLAEHRAQREKEQKLLEKQLEEQRRNPPRIV